MKKNNFLFFFCLGRFFQISMNVIVIALMAYITAFMEAFTIAKVFIREKTKKKRLIFFQKK